MKFKKIPIVIDAIQYRGQHSDEIKEFFGYYPYEFDPRVGIKIATLDGVILVEQFDWIIRGVKGNIYGCKPDIFELSYELIEEE